MFEINKKFTQDEMREIEKTIAFLAIAGVGKAPTNQEEFDDWCDNVIKNHYENIEKKNTQEQKKLNKKIAKAQEKGMTIEEYEEYERKERNYKRHLCEIKKCEREIERLKEEIKYHKEKAEFWKIF